MRDGQTTRRVQECTSSVCAVLGKNETEESKIFAALAQSDDHTSVLVDVFADLALRIQQLTDIVNNEKKFQAEPLTCEEQQRNVLSAENDILRRNIQQMQKQNSKLGKRNTNLQIKNDDFKRHNQSLVQDSKDIFSDLKGVNSINQQMEGDLATFQQEMNNIVQKYGTRLAPSDTGASTNNEYADFDSMDVV